MGGWWWWWCVDGIKIHLRLNVCLMFAPCSSEAVQPLNGELVFEMRPVMSNATIIEKILLSIIYVYTLYTHYLKVLILHREKL